MLMDPPVRLNVTFDQLNTIMNAINVASETYPKYEKEYLQAGNTLMTTAKHHRTNDGAELVLANFEDFHFITGALDEVGFKLMLAKNKAKPEDMALIEKTEKDIDTLKEAFKKAFYKAMGKTSKKTSSPKLPSNATLNRMAKF